MKIFAVLFSLMLLSCSANQNQSLSEVERRMTNEWLYAYAILDFKLNGVEVVRPPGIPQLLFNMTLPAEGGVTLKTHCVYYQVPYKQISGKLTIQELKTVSACPESPEETWAEIDQIKNFKVTLANFKLVMDFETGGKKQSWTFLLPNLDGPVVHKKYEPMSEKKWRSGLTLLRINQETFLNQNNKYLGKLSDRMNTRSAIRCQQIDKNCNQVGEYRCDDCRYGWYQVVDYNCPQGGSKFCGQNHCGEKGEPACPRGSKVVDFEDAGICQNDLTPVMNADHILICQ